MDPDTNKDTDLRILLVGRSGHGKSSTGNAILGENKFKSKRGYKEKKSELQETERNGIKITVVEVPDPFDTKSSNADKEREFYRSLLMTKPGFHVVAFVIQKTKISDNVNALVDLAFNFFENGVTRHAIVIFTHCRNEHELRWYFGSITDYDILNDGDKDVNAWIISPDFKTNILKCISKADEKLIGVINRFAGNVFLMDNTGSERKKQIQAEAIIKEILRIKSLEHGYFRSPKFNLIEALIQKENVGVDMSLTVPCWLPEMCKYYSNLPQTGQAFHDDDIQKNGNTSCVRQLTRNRSLEEDEDITKTNKSPSLFSRTFSSVRARKKEFEEKQVRPNTGQQTGDAKKKRRLPDLRVLLVGITGHGKSTTGNAILGEKRFYASSCNCSVTKKSEWQRIERNNIIIEVVDTPGLSDTELTNEDIEKELFRSLMLTIPGFHAIALVVKLGRFNDELKALVETFFQFFGYGVERHAFIIFTSCRNVNELKDFFDLTEDYDADADEDNDQNAWIVDRMFKSQINTRSCVCDPKLLEMINRCRGNITILSNEGPHDKIQIQVDAILEEVRRIKGSTGNSCFRNPNFEHIDDIIFQDKEIVKEKNSDDSFYSYSVQAKHHDGNVSERDNEENTEVANHSEYCTEDLNGFKNTIETRKDLLNTEKVVVVGGGGGDYDNDDDNDDDDNDDDNDTYALVKAAISSDEGYFNKMVEELSSASPLS